MVARTRVIEVQVVRNGPSQTVYADRWPMWCERDESRMTLRFSACTSGGMELAVSRWGEQESGV